MRFVRLSFVYVSLNAFAAALILACGAARFVYILRVIRLVRPQRVLAVDFKGACMNNAATMVSSLIKKACIACLLILSLTGLALAVSPAQAYASPTYTMSVVGSDVPSSVNPGDSFTVSLTLENNDSSSYTMYAMSATVRYDTSMLEVVSKSTNNKIDMYTTNAGNTMEDAVLNYMAGSLKGVTWENGTPLMTVTFKALKEGTTPITIQRANISNSTGMGKYACTCNNATFSVTYDIPLPESVTMSLSTAAQSLKVGDVLSVNIDMENIPGAAKGTLACSDNLKLLSIERGSALSGNEVSFEYEQGSSTFSFAKNGGTTGETQATTSANGTTEAAGTAGTAGTGSVAAKSAAAASPYVALDEESQNVTKTSGTVAVAKFECTAVGAFEVSVSTASAAATPHANVADLSVAPLSSSAELAPVGLNALAGDVNNSGCVNIVDAQIVYDMVVNTVYANNSPARESLLNVWKEQGNVEYTMIEELANVNGGELDATDAFAIQYYVHHGVFEEE